MILVTGGAGLIGSNIIYQLNKMGRTDVIVVDNLRKSNKWMNLTSLKYSDYYERDDFFSNLGRFKNKVSTIFHMGACSRTTEDDNAYLIQNNFQLSKDLFYFSKENKCRFIYASSAATYGEGEHGYEDNHHVVDDLRPLNMYGYSKQMFDQWLLRNDYMNFAVGIKFFNVYGPNEYHKEDMRSLVLKAFEQIKKEKTISLFKSYRNEYADGEQKRDFLYVKDAAKMTIHFMSNKETGLFNLGTSISRTWNDLSSAIFATLKMTPSINYIEMPESLKEKYQYYTEANITKLQSTGYSHKLFTLEEAVSDYVGNYLIENKRL